MPPQFTPQGKSAPSKVNTAVLTLSHSGLCRYTAVFTHRLLLLLHVFNAVSLVITPHSIRATKLTKANKVLVHTLCRCPFPACSGFVPWVLPQSSTVQLREHTLYLQNHPGASSHFLVVVIVEIVEQLLAALLIQVSNIFSPVPLFLLLVFHNLRFSVPSALLEPKLTLLELCFP
jgi:hypothetical protein